MIGQSTRRFWIAFAALCIACTAGEERSVTLTPVGPMMDAAAPALRLGGLNLPARLDSVASARPSAERQPGGLRDSIPGGALYLSTERVNSEPATDSSLIRTVEANWTFDDDLSARALFDSLRARWDAYFGTAATCRRSVDVAPPSILAGWPVRAGVAYLDLRLAHEIPVGRETAPIAPSVVLGVQADSLWLAPLLANRARVECAGG